MRHGARRPWFGLAGLAIGLVLGCGGEPAPPDRSTEAASPPRGRWAPARGADSNLSAEQQAQMEQLRSIGYVAGSQPAPAATGVLRHEPARALAGYNFYVSGHAPEALLVDMEGRELHRWSFRYLDAFPSTRDSARA